MTPDQGVLDWDTVPVPYARGSDTSREAAEVLEGDPVKGQRLAYFGQVRLAGAHGVTTDEVCVTLGWLVSTGSARANDLHAKLGWMVDSGRRRRTRAGRNATVWVLPEFAPPPEPGP
jgi:hypothetical protein